MPAPDPCTPVTVESTDGAAITACAHGGHLLGWRPAGDGARDLLWLSPMARCGPGEAIRGGVPVIFPQFAARGPLPKHGFARDRAWDLTEGDPEHPTSPGPWSDPGQDPPRTGVARPGVLTAVLTDSEATRAVWPHRFTVGLRLTARGDRLDLTLRVRNDGMDPFTFTAALHAYLSAEPGALLHGLSGAGAEDNADDGTPITLPDDGPLAALEQRDVAVRDLAGQVRLEQPDGRWTTLRRSGFDDVVVWHPGDGHLLSDVPAGRPHFVCLEPAQLSPVTLEPATLWSAGASLVAG